MTRVWAPHLWYLLERSSLTLRRRAGSGGRRDHAAQDELGIQGKGLVKDRALGLCALCVS